MESIQGWLNGFAINQETLLMGLILVTTVLVVMTLGSIIVGSIRLSSASWQSCQVIRNRFQLTTKKWPIRWSLLRL